MAAAFRIVVLASGAVSFHSDEAIVGLMARHINQGHPIPVFFYGQPYMGSLDPLLVALAFRVFGETVLTIRLVQSAVYLGIVGSTLALVYRLTADRRVAVMAGLIVALPPTVMTLYTTISLGGYGELLLIGNLVLLVGFDLSRSDGSASSRWLALGLLAGLGWWTHSLIVVYVLPVALILLRNGAIKAPRLPWRMIAAAAAAFLIGSAPWWLYNLTHDWASVRFLLSGFQHPGQAVGVSDKLAGLFLFGLPTVFGIRFPWAVAPWMGGWTIPLALLDIVLLAGSLVGFSRSARLNLTPRSPLRYAERGGKTIQAPSLRRGEGDTGGEVVRFGRFLWLMIAGFVAIFVLSSFGVDATGRYLLPLVVPFAILLAGQIGRLMQRSRGLAAILGVVLAVNLLGNGIALHMVPPGMTPQFDPATDFPNDSDQAAIDFLLTHGGKFGYSTYWGAYRLVFLSHEAVILSPQLPYKATLIYTAADRYPAYTRAVDAADRPVLVTANLPKLDEAVSRQLDQHGITYRRQSIGPYTIFYDLSKHTDPAGLGLQALAPE